LSTEGVYSRDMGRGKSREGGGLHHLPQRHVARRGVALLAQHARSRGRRELRPVGARVVRADRQDLRGARGRGAAR